MRFILFHFLPSSLFPLTCISLPPQSRLFRTIGGEAATCGLFCPSGASGSFQLYLAPTATGDRATSDAAVLGAVFAKALAYTTLEKFDASGFLVAHPLCGLRASTVLFKHIAGEHVPPTLQELGALDPALARSLSALASLPPSDLADFTFTAEVAAVRARARVRSSRLLCSF